MQSGKLKIIHPHDVSIFSDPSKSTFILEEKLDKSNDKNTREIFFSIENDPTQLKTMAETYRKTLLLPG